MRWHRLILGVSGVIDAFEVELFVAVRWLS